MLVKSLMALAITIVLVGCLQSSRESSVKTVEIGTFSRTINYAPYFVAKKNGYFEEVFQKYGVTGTFTEFQSLAPINEAFETGNLDVIFEADIPAIIGRSAGVDIKIVGTNAEYYQELVLPINSNINSVGDLRGKKIGVLVGTSSHYSLMKMLSEEGMTKNDIQLIDIGAPEGQAAFETGQLDAWAVWPPFVEKEQLANRAKTLRGKDILSIMAVHARFAEENPRLSEELVAAVNKAKKWISENPEQAQELVSKELSLSLEVVEASWPKHDFMAVIGKQELEELQLKADFLYDQKSVKRLVNVSQELIFESEKNA